jgi:hypothetical protein
VSEGPHSSVVSDRCAVNCAIAKRIAAVVKKIGKICHKIRPISRNRFAFDARLKSSDEMTEILLSLLTSKRSSSIHHTWTRP